MRKLYEGATKQTYIRICLECSIHFLNKVVNAVKFNELDASVYCVRLETSFNGVCNVDKMLIYFSVDTQSLFPQNAEFLVKAHTNAVESQRLLYCQV